jgi:threonylcarbamoyladenosine tRNA methylthiotransferase CDKAL1
MERISRGEKILDLRDDAMPYSLLPKTTINRMISILPISYGCLGSCSYCCVRNARGRLRSYSIEDVLARLRRDLEAGAKEVWLTSQDTGAYGKDIGENLIKLLDKVIEQKGEFFVRIGMMNPNHTIEMLHELVEVYKHQKIYKFIHIPVQSGDNGVLRSMNRGYTVEDFKETVNAFRREIPEITLSTDIICGFPSETEEAFGKSVRFLKEIKPDVLNISKFFARPNTPAERMKPLPSHIIKERSRNIAELHRRIGLEKNRRWLRWEGSVLVNNFKRGSWVGRNIAYKPVVLDTEREGLLGEKVRVRIKAVKPTYLTAKCFR